MKSTITSIHPEQITIRLAYPDDGGALRALAALDSANPIAEPALIAEAGGKMRAALSLVDGAVVADPFESSEQLIVLLQVHAAQIGEPVWNGGRRSRSAAAAAAAVWRALAPRNRGLSPSPRARMTPATTRDEVVASSPQAWLRAS
jgi:hypothetical protein